MEGLTGLVNAMGDATTLFKEVESLGFRHLEIDVTSVLERIFFQEMSFEFVWNIIFFRLCGCLCLFFGEVPGG